MTYKVYLTNFGIPVYEGPNSVLAMDKAESTGFQCTVIEYDGKEVVKTMFWCPISKWSW
jgi:hypothetical protein